MGKLKPIKKGASPLKISTSLFQKRGRQSEESSDSSTPVPSPSLRKVMKGNKAGKAGAKTKVSPKGSRVGKAGSTKGTVTAKPTSPKAKLVKKLEKGESPAKKKVGTKAGGKAKAEVKGKASPVKAGAKAKAEPKPKPVKKPAGTLKGKKKEAKEKAGPSSKVKKEKSPPPKSRAGNVLRGRSRSSNSVDSSSSSSSTTSSSSRSPSPSPTRAKATKSKVLPKTKKPLPKKQSPGGSPGKKGAVGGKAAVKGAKGIKPKLNIVKKTAIGKAKGKQIKPKAKVKRMASLNAKAILEASFSFDSAEKKRSPASTPTKAGPSKVLSAESDIIDLKPLTLLFSSGTDTGFPLPSAKSSLSQQQKVGERKRKSSSTSMLKPSESPASSRRESEASNGAPSTQQPTPATGSNRRDSFSSGSESSAQLRKGEKAKSRSPGPKKKAKVTSSSVSTSTSPFDPNEEPVPAHYHHQLDPHQENQARNRTMGTSAMLDRRGIPAQFSVQVQSSPHHPGDIPNHHHSTSSGGTGAAVGSGKGQKSSQIKEKSTKSISSTPVEHFGSTVYQPAGPLIEPHKVHSTGMVPVGLLPDTVRIPSDLKVTYQTRPPTTCVLTVSSTASSTQSSKGSGGSKLTSIDGGRHHKNSSSSTTTTAASNPRSSSKQILHQPYKSSTTTSAPSTTASSSSRSLPQTPSLQSSFTSPASFMSTVGSLTSPLGSTVTLSHQQGQGPLPSHLHPSSSILAAASSAGTSNPIPGSGIYYGYGGPHQSPFAPSKYPIVAPDTYRTHSPYPSPFLYAPTTPQPPGNYFMASSPSFYASAMTPNPGPAGLGAGATQPRPLFAAHQHPSLSSITGASYYQPTGPPPSAHPASNYYVAAPPIPPSHHSMQPSTAPGRAGNIQASSSRPACPFPTESSRMNSNSISSNSNSTNNSNSSRVNKSLQPKRPPLQPATSVTPRVASAPVGAKPNPAANKNSRRKECSTPALATDPPKSFKQTNSGTTTVIDLVKSQAKQLESAKTFTEQYSLPDDITITPIIMTPGDTKSLTFTSYGAPTTKPVTPVVKKRDIVHVIDPRSGERTTIAKHISNSNINKKASPPRNVSSVKPNNAGKVGKISPALDVIVLGPGKTSLQANRNSSDRILPSPKARSTPNHQRAALASFPVVNSDNNKRQLGECKGQIQPCTKPILPTPNTNMVQPLQLTKNENKTIKRKGLSLHECIDGLQRKKMRILADTNISITNVTGPNNNSLSQFLSQNQGLTIVPSNTATNNNNLVVATQKSSRKDSKPRQRQSRNPPLQSPPRSSSVSKRTISTESDLGTKLIDCNAAVAAVRALVVPSAQTKLPTISSPPMQAYSLTTTGVRKRVTDKRKPLKIKITRVEGKITTRSTTQNSKLRTRASKAPPKSKAGEKAGGRGKGRLLRDGARSDSSHGCSPSPSFPYFNSAGLSKEKAGKVGSGGGNGSSTLTTVNNHVILRIPKNSNERPKNLGGDLGYGRSSNNFPVSASSSGNMTMNALKKRAIVKPLSPSLVNGALHSLAMSSKKLPIHTHPRWSNGWRFEGSAFEAKVYIKNDDNPVLRRCYPAMRHDGGDVIHPRDCVLLKSGPKKTDLPFVAKVAAVWENPLDGEMMFSLLWYYRPEHTDPGRSDADMSDEIFASKHRDSNSVATIEDKCYVLTFNEYCRYKKRLKQLQEGISGYLPLVPLSTNSAMTSVAVTNYANNLASAVWSGMASTISATTDPSSQSTQRVPSSGGKVSPEAVFFCRRVYDYRQKRIMKNPS